VSQKTLNLGILAHVDAGKTTLTERLLYESGVIDELGSVDAGTTQTDSLTLERERGIGGRGRARVHLRRVPAGKRRSADRAADDGESAQPRRVHDASRGTGYPSHE
jgi:hypothetical protein